MKILAVLPTYNERENVGVIAEKLLALPLNLAILFVDDNSPDGTADRVRELAIEYPSKIDLMVRIDRPRGLGNAYKDGFSEAIKRPVDAILQMDSDGQHPVEAVPRMAQMMLDGELGLVIGSRYVSGGGTGEWGAARKLISSFAGFAARRLLNLPYQDLTGGFKLWRRDVLAEIEPHTLTSKGYVFQIETTLRANRRGVKGAECPFVFGERERGESKMSREIAIEAAKRMLTWAVMPERIG